jgi:hypothetical protein
MYPLRASDDRTLILLGGLGISVRFMCYPSRHGQRSRPVGILAALLLIVGFQVLLIGLSPISSGSTGILEEALPPTPPELAAAG